MSKKRYKWLVLSSVSAVTACAMFAVGANAASGVFGADHTNHEGYHYERVESTCVEHGHEEFWTCCVCHQHFTTQPTGNFTDRGSQDPYAGVVPEDVLLDLADHNYQYTVPTDHIGNKTGVCETCSDTKSIPMVTADVNLANDEHAYGANATGHPSPTQEGNRGLVGGIMWANPRSEATNMQASFPKVDYTVFTNVIFEFGTSSATWGGSYVGLSIDSEKDLLDIPSGVDGVYGAITAQYDEATEKLTLTSKTSTGVVKIVTVTDENVINGTSSLSGTFVFGTYRCFYLNRITLDHIDHAPSSQAIASTFAIGHKVAPCEICLADTPTSEIMTDADIAISGGYGVHVDGIGGFVSYKDGRFILSNGDSTSGTIYLPRVEFNAYSTVRFSMYHRALWGKLGFSSDNAFGGFGNDGGKDHMDIYLDVTRSTDGYSAVLTCPDKNKTVSALITDENVLSGKASLELFHSQGAYTELSLTNVNVTVE
ncbi:MAG: hypothetical protein MJ239_03575 [Bacilli bacterium]|nr:hypothetical protein [Bacilli bacterium]